MEGFEDISLVVEKGPFKLLIFNLVTLQNYFSMIVALIFHSVPVKSSPIYFIVSLKLYSPTKRATFRPSLIFKVRSIVLFNVYKSADNSAVLPISIKSPILRPLG